MVYLYHQLRKFIIYVFVITILRKINVEFVNNGRSEKSVVEKWKNFVTTFYIKISNFQQMQVLEYNLKFIILLNVIWVYSDEQRPKTPILKIIKDENSIVALGLQKSFKRFS